MPDIMSLKAIAEAFVFIFFADGAKSDTDDEVIPGVPGTKKEG
jgi:hypothetical protein